MKLTLAESLYRENNKSIRRGYLNGKYNGGTDTDYQFHDENRIPTQLKNRKLQISWREKPEVPWTQHKFTINDRWKLGADLPDFKHTDAGGTGNLIPIPRLTYDYGSVSFSSLYFPQVQGYNLNAVMGLYLSVKF